jgi:16S rRNA (adenine1518-N6/adenine1519-N6)-dimethyltransferase
MPLTPSDTRALLTTLGHQPKRFLGQNFLVDGNIVRKSLELGEVKAGDRVVEIGPGLGTLTSALLNAGASVWAVEKDRHLHAYLEENLVPKFPQSFHLIEGDGVELPRAALPDELARHGFKVVANLPYAISTPWMDEVLSGPLPERMVLMLQQEAAQRYSAGPGTKQFSAISIFLQAAYELAPGHKVSASCFYPKPDIESYLLHLVRKEHPFVFNAETKALVRGCFQQRRKQIGSLLKDRAPVRVNAWIKILAEAQLGPQARPEEIPVDLWTRLSPT